MQVLEDDHQRLLQALAQENPLDRFQRAAFLDLPVSLREWIVALDDSEQAEQVWHCIFEATVEYRDFACDLFAPLALIVGSGTREIVA
jgi:hypothetical protein